MKENVKKLLEKQRYKVFNHSAVKLCLWTKKSIQDKGFCYKQKFYGIKSHRCMQCTPAVAWCSLKCNYCWRPLSEATLGIKIQKEDEPKEIVEKMVEAQRKLLTGLGGVPHNEKKLKEAQQPKHAAISLAGEPTIYSRISDLIKEFHKRNMTTFLVTNGTFPERLENLKELPTQLYVSVCSNSKEMFKKVHNPLIKNGWERLNKSLELLPEIKTRKVIRLTLAKDLNFSDPEKYALLIEKTSPNFIEVKAAMPVGSAKDRLKYEQMPLYKEIKEFAEKISNIIGYKIVDEKSDSRVVLLGK